MTKPSISNFERKFRRAIKKLGEDYAQSALVDVIFEKFDTRVLLENFIQAVTSSAGGNDKSSMASLGTDFCLEYVITRLKNSQNDGYIAKALSMYPEAPSIRLIECNDYSFGNVVSVYEFDAKIAEHIVDLKPNDFVVSNFDKFLFLDRKTKSFGFHLKIFEPFNDQHPLYALGCNLTHGETPPPWDLSVNGHPKIGWNGYSTGPLRYISRIECVYGTVDKLMGISSARQKHLVRSHTRRNQSGTVSKISEHSRRNKLTADVNRGKAKDHVVYFASDIEKKLRYIGEGQLSRPKHVNSGVSSNKEINRHFFTLGEMDVKIFKSGLTKPEAVAIERLLLKKHSGGGLWNIKDYEPFNEEFGKGFSDEELQRIWENS